MKLIYRKTFFWTAVFLFLVAAPLLILNASGFRYDFQEKSLIQTGTLILKTEPAGARVWINHEERVEKTPAEIKRLLPERYSIRIEADHFYPWQKEVEVHEAEITLKDKILLIPKEIPLSPVASRGARTFALSPDGGQMVYARRGEDSTESVWLLDLAENKEQPLFQLEDKEDNGESAANYSIDRLFWSSDSRRIALAVSSPEENLKRYFLIETGRDVSPFEIVLPGREDFREWKWSEDGESFFFIHQQFLYRADPVKRMIEQVVRDKVSGYTTVGNVLYFMSASSPALFKKELLSDEPTLVRSIETGGTESHAEKGEHVSLSSDGKKALLTRGGTLWVMALKDDLDQPSLGEPIAKEVENASFSGDGRKILYQTPKGLFVHDLKETGPDGGRKAGLTDMLIQQKSGEVGPVWYGDQAHVLYGAGDTIFIAEAGEGGNPSIYPLVRTPGESPRFVYNNKIKETLYLIYHGQIYQADLSFKKPALIHTIAGRFRPPHPPTHSAQSGLFGRIQGDPKAERSSELPLSRVRS
jgi:hypothetical protein